MENVVFKRKFRWTLEGTLPGGELKPLFVKVAARPNLNIEEIEQQNGTWIPGKAEWEAITITVWEATDEFWKVVTPSVHVDPGEAPEEKLGTFKLTLYDGCGFPLETWELFKGYIASVNFGDLDFSSCELPTIEFTVKYKEVKYLPNPDRPSLSYPATTGGMGLGKLGGNKVKCPKCEHEFTQPGCNIIF